MDFQKWGEEYLREAEALKTHLAPVQKQLKQKGLNVEESRSLAARETMLYQMYLECRATGTYLRGCCQ